MSQPLATAFVRPVDPAAVPGYVDIVSHPMDLVSGDFHETTSVNSITARITCGSIFDGEALCR